MSAPGITYSGVLARKGVDDDSADVDAGVFRGLKFWVSVRVPQRKTCIGTIEENGGTVVPKEGNADMLICDQAKEPVPGSYSYQLISDAVKEGSLDMKEDYMCNSLPPRPGISRKPATKPKLTRTMFTEEDDRILTKFVIERERLGEPISGNEIYKKLAEEYPHHSWQSWRDRWVKKLKSIPRPPVSDRERSPQPKGTPAALGRETAIDKSPVTRSRARFTTEEDDILLETIHRAIKNHKPWNGYPPFEQLASEFPQRTYLAWRERALNHVAKQNKDQIAQWEFEAGFHPNDKEDARVDDADEQQTPTVENNASIKLAVTSQGSRNAPIPAINRLSEENIPHKSINGDDNEDQCMISSPTPRARSAKPPAGGKLTAKGDPSNYLTSSPIFDTPQLPEDGEAITTEGQFYRDYNTFLESAGITERRIPSIRGKAIALWDLWQSVRSKKVVTTELDWQQVAEDLGFDWVSMESIPKDLQQCYEEHLAPFADAMMSFNESSDEEDSTGDNTDVETERLLPSSPPVRQSLKRPFATTSPVYVPQSSPKRRRIDRSHEIPSTPQHENGKFNFRSWGSTDKTPTSSRLGHSSVVGSISRTQARSSARDRDEITTLPEQPQAQKRRLEPETQDFNFGPDTQIYTHSERLDHFDDGSQRETTPSQQLLLESDARSPEIQCTTPVLAASRQETAQITPTPRRKIRVSLQLNDLDDDDAQRNSKGGRSTRAPLSAEQAQPKRRTLPPSFISKSPVSSTVVQNDHQSSAAVPETEPQQRPSPPEETPDDIIDRFVSLGYAKDIVLRSLKATSWIIGNAGQVMEMLQQGEPLPPRTTGVWTQRDDDSLELVYSPNPPSTTREEKRREKEMKRLQAKHGAEQIALRKRYLLDELPE